MSSKYPVDTHLYLTQDDWDFLKTTSDSLYSMTPLQYVRFLIKQERNKYEASERLVRKDLKEVKICQVKQKKNY